jgi:hypothetical protein
MDWWMAGLLDGWDDEVPFIQQSNNPRTQSVIGEVAEWSIAAVLKTASA